jgi:adenine-specific DNA glycosylase
MELGGTLCSIHGDPACGRCPISSHCLAFQRQGAHIRHAKQADRVTSVTDFPIKVCPPHSPEPCVGFLTPRVLGDMVV